MRKTDTIIEARNLKKCYETGESRKGNGRTVEVLQGCSLAVKQGEYVAVMGRSGGGKTTLLRILGLTLRPTEGTVFFQGRDTGDLWEEELADIRRRDIGFVYQDFQLLDSLSALHNIILPGLLDKRKGDGLKEQAFRLGERFGLPKDLLGKAPYELSGGEKQRVAICRALINNPALVLADEPTGNLDEKSAGLVAGMLKEIHEIMGKTIIMVTHNPQLARQADRTCILREGRMTEN